MSYNHAKKVGNQGDVWKHFALLIAVGEVLKQGAQGVRYRETHCGRAMYVLPKKGGWQRGIGQLLPLPSSLNSYAYFSQFSKRLEAGDTYPSSWLQVGNLLAERGVSFNLEIYDISPEVAEAIEATSHPVVAKTEFVQDDGFEALLRGGSSNPADFTLIDSPYSPDAERNWKRAALCGQMLKERAARFLIWYPIYWPTKPVALVKGVGSQGFELLWRPFGGKPSQVQKGCGVVADVATSEVFRRHEQALLELAGLLRGRFNVRL